MITLAVKLSEVLTRIPGFNSVDGWLTENGELVITLSNRNTNDSDVLLRIRNDEDVILVDEAERAYTGDADAWEDASTQLGRLNQGGNWDEPKA